VARSPEQRRTVLEVARPPFGEDSADKSPQVLIPVEFAKCPIGLPVPARSRITLYLWQQDPESSGYGDKKPAAAALWRHRDRSFWTASGRIFSLQSYFLAARAGALVNPGCQIGLEGQPM